MKECPKCGTLFVSGWCRSCGEGKPSGKLEKVVRDYGAEARAPYQAGWPNSSVLTEQQWYNVCRFFPFVASKCSRALPDVGPHNPLHGKSSAGMLMGDAPADPKSWARKLLAAHENGDALLPVQIQFAREALGVRVAPVMRDLEAEAERAAIQGEA